MKRVRFYCSDAIVGDQARLGVPDSSSSGEKPPMYNVNPTPSKGNVMVAMITTIEATTMGSMAPPEG